MLHICPYFTPFSYPGLPYFRCRTTFARWWRQRCASSSTRSRWAGTPSPPGRNKFTKLSPATTSPSPTTSSRKTFFSSWSRTVCKMAADVLLFEGSCFFAAVFAARKILPKRQYPLLSVFASIETKYCFFSIIFCLSLCFFSLVAHYEIMILFNLSQKKNWKTHIQSKIRNCTHTNLVIHHI